MTIIFIRIKQTTNHDINLLFEARHQSPPMVVVGTTNGPRYGAATSVGIAVEIAST